MANRLSKLQKLVYVPAVAPVAARSAYCVGIGSYQSSSGIDFGSGSVAPVQPESKVVATFKDGKVTYTISYTETNYSSYAPKQVTQQVCYPAVKAKAGSPARIDVLDNFGWDAGARSIAPIPSSGYFRAQLPPSPIGVQVGFCRQGFASNYSEMTHSLIARRDQFTVVEAGSQVFGPAALPASSVFEVRRAGGLVSYRVNGDEVYQSAAPSSGEIYGGALLYAATDYVDSPAIGEVGVPISFAMELPALVSAISDDPDYNLAQLTMPALSLQATLDPVKGDIQFSATLPAMVCAISQSATYNAVSARLPAVTLRATLGRVEEVPNNFIAVTPPLVVSAMLRSGPALECRIELPFAFVAADIAVYNRVDAELPLRLSMRTQETYLPSDMVDGSEGVVAADVHSLELAMLLVGIDSLEVGGSASLVFVLELAGMDSLSFADSASIGSIIEMLAMEQVSIMGHAGAARQQALQYAVNYLTGALTTYQDFDFLGFTHHEGQAFAWRKDGLYRIGVEGEETMRLLVDFGATDYAEARLKRAGAGFVGVRTDGECYLRITTDDEVERVYKLIGNGNQKRATLAKGVESRYWNVCLELTDASFATLDNIELEVGVTQRRSFTRR